MNMTIYTYGQKSFPVYKWNNIFLFGKRTKMKMASLERRHNAFSDNIVVKTGCGELDVVVTTTVRSMCVRECVRPDHNFYNCGWVSK